MDRGSAAAAFEAVAQRLRFERPMC